MIRYLTLAQAIKLHDEVIELSGGMSGYGREQIGHLESTLELIQVDDYYPSFVAKITHLIFACVKFHPFLDGNKRSSIFFWPKTSLWQMALT